MGQWVDGDPGPGDDARRNRRARVPRAAACGAPAREPTVSSGRWAAILPGKRAKPTGSAGSCRRSSPPCSPTATRGVRSVAKVMRVSTRTLQRRLSDEGVTFIRVVARARFAVARQMLDDPARKVIDIALDLGYSDPAHFARAFARWTGLAPREFRRLRGTSAQRGGVPG